MRIVSAAEKCLRCEGNLIFCQSKQHKQMVCRLWCERCRHLHPGSVGIKRQRAARLPCVTELITHKALMKEIRQVDTTVLLEKVKAKSAQPPEWLYKGATPPKPRPKKQAIPEDVAYLRSLPYVRYLKTSHWKKTRKLALERAGHCCAHCLATENLQVHHLTYARLGMERQSDLKVLCGDCHRTEHGIEY